MFIKRMLVAVFILCVLPVVCMAESAEWKEEKIFYAMDGFQEWMNVLEEKQLNVQDEDSLYMTAKYLETMLFMNSVLLNSNVVSPMEESELPVFSWVETKEENGELVMLQTDTCRMSSGNKYSCQASYTDDYYQMILYTYGQDDTPAGEERIEIARKDEELLVTFCSYHAGMDIVSRFATWFKETDAETVYTQVFGSEMDIVLKPKNWCEGKQEIEAFTKDLLLPVH